ncbi:replication protein [Bdellovibrionota bacterium FG-1]
MKAKLELKNALEALQVRKPLRLPSSAPTFAAPQPPSPQFESITLVPVETGVAPQTVVPIPTQVPGDTTVAVPTMVAVETQVQNVSAGNCAEGATLVGSETVVPAQTRVATEAQAPTQTPVALETRVPGDATVPAPTQVLPRTMVDRGTQVHARGEVHHAPEQDSAVVLETQASPKLQHGYTRIPNSLLMRMVSGDLLRSEMQVALLIGRFTISYQRKFSPISKAVIERQTGLRGPAVLQALAELVAKGVIEKIPGDQNRPNQFGFVSADEVFNPTTSTLVSPATPVPVATQVAARTPALVSVATTAPVAAGTYFKDNSRYRNTLSQLPDSLQKYFDELKPAKKRESEWKAFESLQGDYCAEDIADCLIRLEERGVGESAQPCHSPMAYLSKAMGEVLNEVEARRFKAHERIERELREAEAEKQKLETEAREADEWTAKENAFNKAFSSEERQREVLVELLRGLPFSPNSQPGRIMGIGRWWNSQNIGVTGC